MVAITHRTNNDTSIYIDSRNKWYCCSQSLPHEYWWDHGFILIRHQRVIFKIATKTQSFLVWKRCLKAVLNETTGFNILNKCKSSSGMIQTGTIAFHIISTGIAFNFFCYSPPFHSFCILNYILLHNRKAKANRFGVLRKKKKKRRRFCFAYLLCDRNISDSLERNVRENLIKSFFFSLFYIKIHFMAFLILI